MAGAARSRGRDAPDEELLEDLFPAPVVCVRADAAAFAAPLRPEEEAAAREASPKRTRELRAGRACAREALRRLGLPDAALPRGPEGAPRWPPGAVGSISHCPGLCAAAAAPADVARGVGLDVERAGRAGRRVLERIAAPVELRHLAVLPVRAAGDWPTLLFAVKEALYKCVAGRAAGPLRFRDALVTFDPGAGLFRAERASEDDGLPATLHGWFRASRTHVAAGVVWWRAEQRPPDGNRTPGA